jgi:outer membrane lipoprotein-sorting protein
MNRKIKNCICLAAFIVAGALVCSAQETDPDGATILARVDAYRAFSDTGFSFDFALSEEGGGKSLMRVYLDSANRDNNSIAQYLEPRRYNRRVVLSLGHSFYIYDQGMMAPIRITPREMLFGQAAAGDITRISFTVSYSVEQIQRNGDQLVLHLKAKPDKDATYDLIELRVNAAAYKPLQAECKGASGTVIKLITYTQFERINGRELLTGFTITDSATGKVSTIGLGNFRQDTLPSSGFSVEALKNVR